MLGRHQPLSRHKCTCAVTMTAQGLPTELSQTQTASHGDNATLLTCMWNSCISADTFCSDTIYVYTLIPTVLRALLKSAVSGTDHRVHTTKQTQITRQRAPEQVPRQGSSQQQRYEHKSKLNIHNCQSLQCYFNATACRLQHIHACQQQKKDRYMSSTIR